MRKLTILAALATAVAVATAATLASASTRAHSTTRAAAMAAAKVKCGSKRTLGFMAPFTGPAASVGQQQVRWVKYWIKTYNKTHKKQIKAQNEDTMLGAPNGTAEALKGAQALSSSSKVMGVVGPAGSNEIVAVTKTLKKGGLAWVSGSSTRTTLTTDGTRTGFMFRTVPPDKVQGATVAKYIAKTLKLKRVFIIDDEETYSTGLANTVQSKLKAAGVHVKRAGISQSDSNFASVIATIPGNNQLVYIPWQLTGQAIPFLDQLRQAGKGSMRVMGSDGLFDPSFASEAKKTGIRVYDSFFPLNPKSPIVAAYKKAHHGHGDYFGAPSYAAAQVVTEAISKACAKGHGKTTRAQVRKMIAKTRITAGKSVIGVPLRFNHNGDLATLHKFGIYRAKGGQFVPIA